MRKFLSASNILACASFMFALIFLIIYVANINTVGYFQGVKAPLVVPFAIIVMVLDLFIIGRSYILVQGVGAKVLNVVTYVAKAVVPMLLIFAALTLIQTRIEGIGYIFFSNVDVQKEVATPENVASAVGAIVAVVFGLFDAVLSVVGAFFLPKEEEADQAQVVVE